MAVLKQTDGKLCPWLLLGGLVRVLPTAAHASWLRRQFI
jgi:hypothetical protein